MTKIGREFRQRKSRCKGMKVASIVRFGELSAVLNGWNTVGRSQEMRLTGEFIWSQIIKRFIYYHD